MDIFQSRNTSKFFCVLVWSDVIDCGISRRCGDKCSSLSSGLSLVSVSVLACNADRMCQQIKPNETHLSSSLEQLLCASVVSALGHADCTRSSISRRCLHRKRRGEFLNSEACLTQEVMKKSDKKSPILSHFDI